MRGEYNRATPYPASDISAAYEQRSADHEYNQRYAESHLRPSWMERPSSLPLRTWGRSRVYYGK